MKSPFLSKAVLSFQWFVSYSSPSGSKDANTVYGSDALRLMLKDCQKKHKEQQATLQDVAPLKVYEWLLPEALRHEVDALAKQVSATATNILPIMKGSSKKPKEKASGNDEDHVWKAALDMFK